MRSHEEGFNKPLENKITYNDERMYTEIMPRPTMSSNLISTILSHLVLRQFQLHPRCQGRVGHEPEIFALSVAHKGELRNIPEGGGVHF